MPMKGGLHLSTSLWELHFSATFLEKEDYSFIVTPILNVLAVRMVCKIFVCSEFPHVTDKCSRRTRTRPVFTKRCGFQANVKNQFSNISLNISVVCMKKVPPKQVHETPILASVIIIFLLSS